MITRLSKPPEIPEESEIQPFSNDLLVASEHKLIELLGRLEELEDKHSKKIKKISWLVVNDNLDRESEYFWTMFAEVEFIETVYIYKWIEYWLKLYEIVSKQVIIIRPVYVENNNSEINQEKIDRAKQVPIESVFDGELKYMGNRILACCPIHGERTPSFTIFTEDNHFHCFGCHVGGDVIDFIMKTKNLNLIEAVKELNHDG